MSRRDHRAVDYDSVAPSFAKRYERHDYSGVEQTLLDFIGTGAHHAALEVGCGTGHWLGKIAERLSSVVGIDPSEGMLRQVDREAAHFDVGQACAEALPFPSNSFDRIVCITSFHHFSDRAQFVGEAKRVLRTGGGLITVGLDPHQGHDQWWIHDYFPSALEFDLERYLPCQQIRDLMSDAGFDSCQTIEAQHHVGGISEKQLREQPHRLNKKSTSQLMALTDDEYADGVSRISIDMRVAEDSGASFELRADLRLYATIGWVAGAGNTRP